MAIDKDQVSRVLDLIRPALQGRRRRRSAGRR